MVEHQILILRVVRSSRTWVANESTLSYTPIAQWNRAQRYERWSVVGSNPSRCAEGNKIIKEIKNEYTGWSIRRHCSI